MRETSVQHVVFACRAQACLKLWAFILAAAISVVVGCGDGSTAPSCTVSAGDVRQFLKLRNSFDPSVNNQGAEVFRKGRVLSEGALAVLAPFRDRPANGKARYVIGASETRYPTYWWVTISVDSETAVITDYEYVCEEEDRSGREGDR